jgi:beta-phosphoglucomutase-like phosphatase (HAD superfamily)
MKKLYVFDLDGVLIDSLPNMKMSWGIVQLKHKIDIPFSEYEKHIGKPFEDILTAIGIDENHSSIKLTYDEASIQGDEVKIYPGVIKTLKELKKQGSKCKLCYRTFKVTKVRLGLCAKERSQR